ncbi:membrane protease YdiL (CAAX protease family) [Lewinella aquimaris]|uniref:Membrane protease YdiL (CAAX protease family) n=1 Tax=Neolewinella aquimaris TaxID=1835722 RepID=A0A840E9I4_9BACT|nr:CPBP family intramembrane glutamic endopeptidase [Neolewinella aquimaris]MBB4078469.1 membrane protease YdiL (CAAX protease family) [Neolewinella aquimaris]
MKYYCVTMVGLFGICYLFPQLLGGSSGMDVQTLREFPTLAFISICVLAPTLEELLFRGLILDRLRRSIPVYLSIVLSAAIFALMHGLRASLFPIFTLGIALGYLYHRYDSLYACILFHFIVNTIWYLISR